MFPRRSSVFRYFAILMTGITVFVMWMTGSTVDDNHKVSWNSIVTERSRFHSVNENMSISDLPRHLSRPRTTVPVNPRPFQYIINPTGVCEGKDLFLLIYVHSAPGHFKHRMAIRETWGNPMNFPTFTIRIVFLCGTTPQEFTQEALLMEAESFGDIIQEDFVDSYRNLTYKAIMGLRWISTYCIHAKFFMKTDDDIFVNMFNLVAHLQSMATHRGKVKNLLLCLVWYEMEVMRDPNSKWYLSPTEFEPQFFPTYCSGSAFILTGDVAGAMYKASFETPFFWVDDFYVTGLLAKKVGVVHENFSSVYVIIADLFLQKFTEPNRWFTLVVGHVHNLYHLRIVWRNVLREHSRSLRNNTIS